MHFGLPALVLIYLYYSGLQPSPNRVVGIDAVVDLDSLAGLPLQEDAGGADGDGLVVLVGPAGVVDIDGAVADKPHLGIHPLVDRVEDI